VSPAVEEDEAAALDALVASGPLAVAFQPIVDLERGEPIGYEVLGRCGPLSGPLAEAARGPASLLARAERHGRLLALDRRWRELALEGIAAHEDRVDRDDRGRVFFLNVDPRVVEDSSYVPGFTLDLVERHGLSPGRFVLELTEVPARDPEAVERVLEHYGRQGFRVALDDLGAGQQSLVTLLRLQPHIVKLDRELVRDVHVDGSRAHLLEALAEFSRRAGITLVAEGIETEGELAAVMEAGVPWGQGFLLGVPAPRPMPLSREARATVRSGRRRSSPRGPTSYARDPSLALLDLVEGLRTSPSLEAMLQQVTDGAAALLGVSRVSLRLLDEGRSRLLVAARTGEPLHAGGGADLEIGEGFAGWVALHRAPLRVDDADADPRFVQKPGLVASMRSFVGVPLLDGEGAIGVLAATAPEPDAFSFIDERWLRVVAGAAAPYLEAARRERLAVTPRGAPRRSRSGA
jgi:EAL domain-containing protein (putative c-di-GMP-specific phosphodiesterase class I)/putative methionine-R-sulfoxide reductase with GAF domain